MRNSSWRGRCVVAIAVASWFVLTLSFVSAEETITVDFAVTDGPAGDPIASGFRTGWTDKTPHVSGRATPFELVRPLKPSYIGAPSIWPPSDSLWIRAAETGATVIAVLGDPCPIDPAVIWADEFWASDTATMSLWREHCGLWATYVDTARVVYLDGDSVRVPVQYDVWNEPDTRGKWHPHASFGDPVDLFFQVWLAAVDTVRSIDSSAVFTGPSFAYGVDGADPNSADSWEASSATGIRMDNLLSFCRAAGCMPDIIGWHFLGACDYRALDNAAGRPRNLYGQVSYARDKVNALFAGSDTTADTFEYEINEMLNGISGDKNAGGLPEWVTPGIIVRHIALAERARTDGLGLILAGRAFWCDMCQPCYAKCDTGGFTPPADMLNGLINPGCYPEAGIDTMWSYSCATNNPDPDYSGLGCPEWGGCARCASDSLDVLCGSVLGPRYSWWVYKAYADLEGQYVPVEPSGTSFDGLAAMNSAEGTASVLLGRYQAPSNPDSLTVILENLNYVPGLVNNGVVEIEVRRYPGAFNEVWKGGITDEDLVVTSFSKRYVVGPENSLTLILGSEAEFDTLDAVSIDITAPVLMTRTAAQE